MFRVAILLCLLLVSSASRAEHGDPGDSLHEHYQIPQHGYLILEGRNGITSDMWNLVHHRRRLVTVDDGPLHIVPLRLVAAYDREHPDFSAAGGYGENCVVLQPTSTLEQVRQYQLEFLLTVDGSETWHRITHSSVSLDAGEEPAPRLHLLMIAARSASKDKPWPMVVVDIRAGRGERLWVSSRVATGGSRQRTTHIRHFAIAPSPEIPSSLESCAFHPIEDSGESVHLQFRVSDSRRRTRWSRRLTTAPSGSLFICVRTR